jgi:hypothetical protein
MIRRLPARAGVAIAYALALVVTTLAFRAQSPAGRRAWLAWASTNLANLGDHPIGAMVTSAFITEGSLLSWGLTAMVGLVVLNWSLGNWRTAALVGTAHVLGTVISQGILAYKISAGVAPQTDRYIIDVGPSYVVACALVAGAAFGLGAQRLPAAGGFALFAPNSFLGLPTLEVSSVGHFCSVVIALAVGWPLWRSARSRAARDATDPAAAPASTAPASTAPASTAPAPEPASASISD